MEFLFIKILEDFVWQWNNYEHSKSLPEMVQSANIKLNFNRQVLFWQLYYEHTRGAWGSQDITEIYFIAQIMSVSKMAKSQLLPRTVLKFSVQYLQLKIKPTT